MVPQTPGTLLDHFWDKTFFQKKRPKSRKRPAVPKPIFLESPCFLKNVKSQWDFLTNRALELKYQGRKMRNQKLIWSKIFHMCIFYMCQVVQDPFLKSWFSSLLLWVDINSKIRSKNDLLNTTCQQKHFH